MTLAETLFVDDGPRLRSARAVLRNLFGFSQPDTVIDVGCGDGAWLRAALELDTEAVFGISQGEPQHGLPEDAFLEADLSEPGLDAKIAERLGRKFDLVLALSVAELLPFERSAGFVEELCRLGDTILFSAAIPWQDGYPNEQWTEFWGLHFRRCGFRCFDLLRLELWANPAVEWRLAQNLLVFVREESTAFSLFPFEAMDGPLSMVHPAGWLNGRAGGADDLAMLSEAWMAGGCDIPAMHRLSVPPAGSRELVLFNGKTEEPPDTEPSIERLQQELAAAKAQVRIANLDLERAAEDLATLRLDKSDAERTAVEEYHLRVNMERDFLLGGRVAKGARGCERGPSPATRRRR